MNEQRIEEKLRSFFNNEVKMVEPSSEWWDNAISRVTEPTQEVTFWEHITRALSKPVWRAALPVAVVLMVIGTLWGTGVLPKFDGGGGIVPAPITPAPITTVPSVTVPAVTTPPKTTTPPTMSLKVTASTDKSSYLPGEQVEIKVSLTNITEESTILDNFPPDTKIDRDGPAVRVFNHGSQQVKLEPGESTTYTVVWDQMGYEYGSEHVTSGTIYWDQLSGEGKPVMPSSYRIGVYVYIIKGSGRTIQGYHEFPAVTIGFPQGTMDKTIEVNQSRTTDDITMNLERIELLADRMKMYVLKTPGYTPSQPDQPEPPSLAGRADIQGTYSIDNGDPLVLGSFGYRIVKDKGVEYIWEDLYPVSADAQTLSFRITRFTTLTGSPIVDSEGPWEFTVKLQ